MIDHKRFNLPISEIVEEVKEKIDLQNTLIIHAPPGAGKSTLLPLCLLEKPFAKTGKIIMLEPRRLAAKTIAARMADMLGEKIGESIGYAIRFERRSGPNTRLEVVTEGILTRMLQSDNALEGVSMVIFDEFHERSIHADLALALCREAQQVLRPDLKIMVMSATLDTANLSQLLQAPVISSPGRQYPVEVFYGEDADPFLLPELCSRTVLKALQEQKGDILVFLPGEGEIRKTEALLKGKVANTLIRPLYGQLSMKEQQAAIFPDKTGRRKIVLATNIAETSLTIEGITTVVDSGFARNLTFDPNTGLSRLETNRITQDSANQRAGRAGRLGPGYAYRMWTKATHERMKEHRVPEIMEAELSALYLELAVWGVGRIDQLAWLDLPPKGNLLQAKSTLEQIEALENGQVTTHGREIHRIPCHPRIAHMMLKAGEGSLLSLATDLAAILEEKDPLPKEAGVDLCKRIEALRRYRNNQGSGGLLGRIEKIAASYRTLMHVEPDNGPVDSYETGFLLAHAFPERIACARPGNNAQFQLANGKIASIHHKDDLAHEAWIAVANIDAREGMGKIFLASSLNPKDLAPLVKQKEVISWDTKKGGLRASMDLRIGSIVLQSKPLPAPDQSALQDAILEAVKKEGHHLLNWDESVVNWLNKINSLHIWRPEEKWPKMEIQDLIDTCEEWLSPYLSTVKTPEDLKRINLKEVLLSSLNWEQQQLAGKLAPDALEVPSSYSIDLQYQADGSDPVMAVRLQELFGWAESPKINEGKTTILMHLLSPGFKIVQITSDLRSFWDNAYFEVKKELKRRYPKHVWPDDPWKEQAIRGVKRRSS